MKQKIKTITVTVFITLLIIFLIGLLTHKKTGFIHEKELTAKAEIPIKVYNYGEISFLDTVNYSFKIKNIGNQPIVIEKIQPSCDCTSVNYTKNFTT